VAHQAPPPFEAVLPMNAQLVHLVEYPEARAPPSRALFPRKRQLMNIELSG